MTEDTLLTANDLRNRIGRYKGQLERVRIAMGHNYGTVNDMYCSESNPFVMAALRYEEVTLIQEIRGLEKKFAEL